MQSIAIHHATHALSDSIRVKSYFTFLCRLRGLTFIQTLLAGEGLWLVQPSDSGRNSAIHILGVFIDLAVIWIKLDRLVVDKVLTHRWHPAYVTRRAARYVLELASEWLEYFQFGDRIEFSPKEFL